MDNDRPSHGPHPVPLTLLDPPERDPQPAPPLPGGDSQDAHSDLIGPFHPGTDLDIAAVNFCLDNPDGPIVDPHRLSTTFRHSGWLHNRLLIYRSLRRTEQPQSRLSNFAHCGSEAYVLQSVENPSVYRIAGSACHDRFCLPCGQERSQTIALNVLELTQGRRVRFLTLTLKASSDPLSAQLDHLYTSFQALRRRKFWTKRVTGGVAFLETTWSQASEAWHPHLHILIEGRYLPHRELRSLWHEITGDSFVLDIRTVPDLRTAANYVTKYAAKPFNNTFLNRPALLDEAVLAFKGRKLLITFGNWRGITLIDKPSEGAWDHVAPLETILIEAAHGDPDACAIVTALTHADLTELYKRAPPAPPPSNPETPPVSQLDFFGVWQADGGYSYPDIDPQNNR